MTEQNYLRIFEKLLEKMINLQVYKKRKEKLRNKKPIYHSVETSL